MDDYGGQATAESSTGRNPPDAPIRVMRIISRLNVGGPSTHVILLNEGLDHLGYTSVLVTGYESVQEGDLRDLVSERRLRMVSVAELGREINFVHDIAALLKLYRLMRRERPHIVHTHQAKAGFVGRLAARLAGVPVVLHTFHGHVFHGYFGRAKTALFLLLERICARLSDRVITISVGLRKELAALGVTSADHIEVIPLGFELDAFARQPPSRGSFRATLGLGADTKLVAAVGRLVKIKNIRLFLNAAALVHAQMPEVHFALVGDGDQRNELENYARSLGLSHVVTFTGWRRDLPEIYYDLDALIISSDNEGTPASLIEAMATGCPVIATRVGGIPDLLGDCERGSIVPPGDAWALARAILQVLDEPCATKRRSAAARGYVLRNHQVQRLVTDMDSLYAKLLNAKGIVTTNRQTLPGTPEKI